MHRADQGRQRLTELDLSGSEHLVNGTCHSGRTRDGIKGETKVLVVTGNWILEEVDKNVARNFINPLYAERDRKNFQFPA